MLHLIFHSEKLWHASKTSNICYVNVAHCSFPSKKFLTLICCCKSWLLILLLVCFIVLSSMLNHSHTMSPWRKLFWNRGHSTSVLNHLTSFSTLMGSASCSVSKFSSILLSCCLSRSFQVLKYAHIYCLDHLEKFLILFVVNTCSLDKKLTLS